MQAPKRACVFLYSGRVKLIILLAFASYVIIIIIASGALCSLRVGNGKYVDIKSAAAWVIALFSTFGLPWGGVPLSRYFGAGSWTWFLFSGISLCILKYDERERCIVRRFYAIANVAVIMAAISVFMLENGIPGDIPGIEGVGAIYTLEGLINAKLVLAMLCFFVSANASFLPVYSRLESAAALLSFSYASFVAIAFLPPVHMFMKGTRPDIAIIATTAVSFICSWLIHNFIYKLLSNHAAALWRRSYSIANSVLTLAGIYFLFSAA